MNDAISKYRKRAYKEFEADLERLNLSSETNNELCKRLLTKFNLLNKSLENCGDKNIIKNEYYAVSRKYLYDIIIEMKAVKEIVNIINNTSSKLLYKDNPIVIDNIIKFKDNEEQILLYILKSKKYTGDDIIKLLYLKRHIILSTSDKNYIDANKYINEKRRNNNDL